MEQQNGHFSTTYMEFIRGIIPDDTENGNSSGNRDHMVGLQYYMPRLRREGSNGQERGNCYIRGTYIDYCNDPFLHSLLTKGRSIESILKNVSVQEVMYSKQ